MIRIAVALVALSIVASGCRATRAQKKRGQYVPASQTNPQIERDVYNRANSYRRSRGLNPLANDPALAAAAREHSAWMARRGKLSHSGFDRRFRQLQPNGYRALAENVAMNLGLDDPASVAVEGWRRSPGHHKNLISKIHRSTGVGVARGRDGSVYLTQLYSSR